MEREPMESLSTRVGREAMAMAASSVALSSVDGLIVGRMPGVKVAGANTCFMVECLERIVTFINPEFINPVYSRLTCFVKI